MSNMTAPGRDELSQWDRQIVWHAFTQMAAYEPWIIERAEGCYLVDVDGRKYLDGVSSLWCNIHGHRHPKLDAAIREQLGRVAHSTSLGASNPTTIQLARRLVDITPAGLNHVFFSDDGATAVEVALKMAFQYWRQCRHPRPGKTRYVALGDAYHGDTLGSVSVSGVERFRAMFAPLLFDVLRLPVPDPTRMPGDVTAAGACDYYLGAAETLLRARHEEIAAFVIEPLVQAAAGMIVHPAGYLRGIRTLTRQYDILLVADEVAVGMGRTGTMFACAQEDVGPDLLCLAKGLTGGYLPLAATLATTEIYQAFLGDEAEQKTFCHGHTYGGNPLGAAAALATLDVFAEEESVARQGNASNETAERDGDGSVRTLTGRLTYLQPKIDRLAYHLRHLAGHQHVRSARQCGLIAGIELVRDKTADTAYAPRQRRGWRVCQRVRAEGVYLRPLGDVIVVMPPLAIQIDQLDEIMRAVEIGIDAATCGEPGSR